MADQLSCSCTLFLFFKEPDYAPVPPVNLAQKAVSQSRATSATFKRLAANLSGLSPAEDQLLRDGQTNVHRRHNTGLLDAPHLGPGHLRSTAPQSYPNLHLPTQQTKTSPTDHDTTTLKTPPNLPSSTYTLSPLTPPHPVFRSLLNSSYPYPRAE
jgi:hypothetical protein